MHCFNTIFYCVIVLTIMSNECCYFIYMVKVVHKDMAFGGGYIQEYRLH